MKTTIEQLRKTTNKDETNDIVLTTRTSEFQDLFVHIIAKGRLVDNVEPYTKIKIIETTFMIDKYSDDFNHDDALLQKLFPEQDCNNLYIYNRAQY